MNISHVRVDDGGLFSCIALHGDAQMSHQDRVNVYVLIPQKGAFENLIRGYPQLHDHAFWRHRLSEPGFDTTCLKHYEEYDGFVVLHGTDTMSYTASALSFMFENIGKCVIPIFEPRSDGSDNFVSSLLIAGGLNIPEVTVFFGSKLFRGNRVRKISAHNLYAFDSPNCPPLVEVGLDIEFNKKAVFKPTVIEKCQLHAKMSKNVGLLRIFPSVVLESYGAGNIPSNRQDLFDEIAAAVKRGVIIVNITQCATGAVASPLYETGRDNTLIDALAGSLNIQSPKKLIEVTEKVFNALLLYAIEHDDDRAVKKMLDMGADVNAQNSEGRTPLHEAILKGKKPIVENLLRNGASVHLKTRCGESPLVTAIHGDDLELISLLLQCGAHLSNIDQKSVSELLSLAARSGAVKKLESLRMAGADLNMTDELRQTPLHKYLIEHGADSNIQDVISCTPLDYALKLDRREIADMINKPN
ncbi:hypothetical protein MSG28_006768 [Choristoneura fumiferana]|uniref:Uncharacterized protein n=1 Tax=Choristoneura fumiferana TaxID=7141 RepID=A0ACC0JL22_CHOFU|nr:hypothetical protein MSG28_006768 [Choristoneura fumiferana]